MRKWTWLHLHTFYSVRVDMSARARLPLLGFPRALLRQDNKSKSTALGHIFHLAVTRSTKRFVWALALALAPARAGANMWIYSIFSSYVVGWSALPSHTIPLLSKRIWAQTTLVICTTNMHEMFGFGSEWMTEASYNVCCRLSAIYARLVLTT